MVEISAIIIGSIAILALSWRSFSNPRSHGFFRFFAFELLLILIVLNSRTWFKDPASEHQLFSWALLIGSLFLAVHGFHLLYVMGRPLHTQPSSTNLDFENTSNLVTVGAYRFIRHPLYASLLLLEWGVLLKNISIMGLCLAFGVSVFLFATARAEERENLERFGQEYKKYMARTRMFIPFIL